MVHRNIPWCKIIVPWWYKDAPLYGYNVTWYKLCVPWYTTVYHGIPLFTMAYHYLPWYTMVVPWYFFIRDRIVVISLGHIAQYNKTEQKNNNNIHGMTNNV